MWILGLKGLKLMWHLYKKSSVCIYVMGQNLILG